MICSTLKISSFAKCSLVRYSDIEGIVTAEDVTVTTTKPDDTIPAVDPADPFFKKGDTLASKVESLDFDKDVEVITTEHPSVIDKTLPRQLPGFTKQRIDTGL